MENFDYIVIGANLLMCSCKSTLQPSNIYYKLGKDNYP